MCRLFVMSLPAYAMLCGVNTAKAASNDAAFLSSNPNYFSNNSGAGLLNRYW